MGCVYTNSCSASLSRHCLAKIPNCDLHIFLFSDMRQYVEYNSNRDVVAGYPSFFSEAKAAYIIDICVPNACLLKLGDVAYDACGKRNAIFPGGLKKGRAERIDGVTCFDH